MSQGKYIFAQLVDFLPKAQFDYIVKKYNANKGIRSSCSVSDFVIGCIRLDGFVIRPLFKPGHLPSEDTDLQSVHKEIEKICYRISNANIQSVRIANPNEQYLSSESPNYILVLVMILSYFSFSYYNLLTSSLYFY